MIAWILVDFGLVAELKVPIRLRDLTADCGCLGSIGRNAFFDEFVCYAS